MTNLGTVVYIGTLYGLDVCYIALSCDSMIPLEIQPLTTYHNDHIWLSRAVQGCLYDISRWDMTVWDIHAYYIYVVCMLYRFVVCVHDPSRDSATYYVP